MRCELAPRQRKADSRKWRGFGAYRFRKGTGEPRRGRAVKERSDALETAEQGYASVLALVYPCGIPGTAEGMRCVTAEGMSCENTLFPWLFCFQRKGEQK